MYLKTSRFNCLAATDKIVITGFNTDIEHGGVIYHVQTEDKGVSTPLILSLVYNRGTILASKRSPYDDLLVPSFNEKALSERLQKQHKLICAAVRAGRIEDLKRMGKESGAQPKINSAPAKAVEAKQESSAVNKIPKPQTPETGRKNQTFAPPQQQLKSTPSLPKQHPKVEPPQLPQQAQTSPQTEKLKPPADNSEQIASVLPKSPTVKIETKTAKPKESLFVDLPVAVVADEPIIEAVAIIEDETILPAEAVAIVAEINQIFDDKLKIELPDGITFRSGERKTVNIIVYRGVKENPSSGSHVMIKVFGAAFRPLIFHAKTDRTGTASVHLQMPQFKAGRAAILIKAMSDGEEVELRRVVEQG